MASELTKLVSLISGSVEKVKNIYDRVSVPIPTVNDAKNPFNPSVALRADVSEATRTAIASCYQLIATLETPKLAVMETAMGFHVTSALRLAVECHIAELLRGKPEGVHVRELAKESGVNTQRLERVLRLLSTKHLFRESRPNVFANTRLSTALDTGKDPTWTFEERVSWYKNCTDAGTTAAFVAHMEEGIKSSAYWPDVLLAPASGNGPKTAFSRAYRYQGDAISWLHQPGNEWRLARFESAALATEWEGSKSSLRAFPWRSLPQDSVCVDLMGGLGYQAMMVLLSTPGHLRLIVQDTVDTIEQAKEFWRLRQPNALESGQVTLSAHDQMDPQPIKNARVYFIQSLHDFQDDIAIKILRNIRLAAGPDSQLLVMERLIPNVCPPPPITGNDDEVVGPYVPDTPPKPLLPNWGRLMPYLFEMQMNTLFGGTERTFFQWDYILHKAGWEIDSIAGDITGMSECCLVCSPGAIGWTTSASGLQNTFSPAYNSPSGTVSRAPSPLPPKLESRSSSPAPAKRESFFSKRSSSPFSSLMKTDSGNS